MKKILTSAFLLCLAFTSQAKNINFGIEATYPPYEFYNDKNELTGFDIDIANKICDILKYKCKFTDQSFDSLLPTLKTKRIDAAISAIGITNERLKQVDFSDSYFDISANKFVISKNKFKSVNDLKNKKIGVQNGTVQQKYLLENFPKANIVNYDSYQYAIIDLKAQRIDAIFGSVIVAGEWLKENPNLQLFGNDVIDPNYFGYGTGIAVKKGNKQLTNELNKALKQMKTDGSYKKIYDKWFKDKK